jgi:DNA mismatch repair protein MutS2
LASVREELRRLRGRLKHAAQPLEALKVIEAEIKTVEAAVSEPVAREEPDVYEADQALELGDRVLLRTLGSEGVISEMSSDHVEVQIGKLRVRTRADELELIAAADAQASEKEGAETRRRSERGRMKASAPPMEIDLRGMVVDDALMELERRLDAAFLAGMPFVRVIHGKGTGRLRQAIRLSLEDNPYTASFEPGGIGEGGDGVTVAHIASS